MISRRLADQNVAIIGAGIAALSPWLLFTSADQLSHTAAAVWLMVFYLAFHNTVFRERPKHAWLAGLGLAAAVMTRPSDAAFFALPCIVYSLYLISFKGWRIWLPRLLPVAMVASFGLCLFLAINYIYFGNLFSTGYGGSLDQSLGRMANQGGPEGFDYTIWLHQSLVDLNFWWFAGVFPAAIPLAAGIWWARHRLSDAWLFLSCTASLALCYGVIVFASRTWFGPRWYVPLIPCIAFLMALGIQKALQAVRAGVEGTVEHQLAGAYLRLLSVTLVVTWALAVPLVADRLATNPPHGVDRRVLDAVDQAGLTQAVVGLYPAERYHYPGTEIPTYKITRTASWTLVPPLNGNPVIYVDMVDNWIAKARQSWPERRLYRIADEPGVFELIPVTE